MNVEKYLVNLCEYIKILSVNWNNYEYSPKGKKRASEFNP